MDFVQRNLINERNNLQIELAKAKIRIAQLNESAVEGLKKVIQNAHADKANLSVAGAQVAASATKALRNMGRISHKNENHHFESDDLKPFELNELSNKTLASYIKKASGVDTEPGFVDWRKRNDVMTLAYDAEGITDAGGDASELRKKLKNRQEGIGRAVDRITKPMSEQTQYISDLENVIATIAESINVSAADLYETYRITPARRDLLDKIQSKAMRDAADAMGPDGEDFRASSIKKSDGALSRISRIELMKMKGKPSDKRTHAQHPMHRFFPDDRSPNQLTDRALNADLAAERKREISNRPKQKKMK